ncbi:MAG: glutathione S-transferase [Alphaproteobacteria bacterium]|jgi:glutathione S-transferase
MRARLAIFKSKQEVELRDVKLTNKPSAMLVASPKGTVPILVVSPSQVIDESLDVMLWSLGQSDPDNLMRDASLHHDLLAFIAVYDGEFKPCIERYKAAKRYHEPNLEDCRQDCEVYIKDLERRLSGHNYVFGESESLADIAILPFIRQFAKVERSWYVQSSYINVKRWLNKYLQSAMFNKVMALHPIWEEGSEVFVFCGD